MNDLTLNNGQTATYKYTDDWSRPVYQLENDVMVCCTELNGSYLHVIIEESGEPCTPLRQEFQPVGRDH